MRDQCLSITLVVLLKFSYIYIFPKLSKNLDYLILYTISLGDITLALVYLCILWNTSTSPKCWFSPYEESTKCLVFNYFDNSTWPLIIKYIWLDLSFSSYRISDAL